MEKDKRALKELILGMIFLSLIGGVFVLGVGYGLRVLFFEQQPSKKTVKEIILRAPECPRDFEDYQSLVSTGQSVQLLKDASSYASGGQFEKSYKVGINRLGSGEVACGYLYIRAKKGSGVLDKEYDSIYINPHEMGGHLLRPKGISKIEKGASGVLFQLHTIPYLPSAPYDPDPGDFRVADWTNLLNASKRINFVIGLSTEDPRGVIEEVRIAYKCWNPDTGKETRTCQLSVKKES